MIRYWSAFDLYEGVSDALEYHRQGQNMAEIFSQFDFSVFETIPQGTESLIYLTGLLYTIFPASLPGSFFLFATLAFTGSVFYYRAFRVAFPEASPNLFRVVIFFLPSILFWPASLGKDAWIFFGSGVVAYGLARLMRQPQLSSLWIAGLGVILISLVRPHVAIMMLLAILTAYVLQGMRTAKQFLGGAVVIGVAIFLVQFSTDYLYTKGLSEFSWSGLQEFYAYNQQQTFQGGSRFTPLAVFTLLGPLYAMVTVLFRPFLWEAPNAQALAVAIESTVWLALIWYRRQIFLSRIRSITTDPWVAFLVVYSFVMILSLASLANFGILARQRVMFLPFLWMLFA
jgi:hypothetical protein